MATRIYTTLAPRWFDFEDGCIERASTVEQGTGREGTGAREGRARVAWRILGGSNDGSWMLSCRTPLPLRGGLGPTDRIGDGSDEAMVAWLLDGGKGRG